MKIKTFIISTLVSTMVLFLRSGLTQLFPWGVPSAKVYITTNTSKAFQTSEVKRMQPYSLTTEKFDELLVNEVNTLETEQTFSWIVTKPTSYYNPTDYFLREIFTQLVVGILLTIITWLTLGLPLGKRICLIVLAGIAGTFATYGQLWNWWGLTYLYACGVSFNLLIGWLLSGFLLCKFVMKVK